MLLVLILFTELNNFLISRIMVAVIQTSCCPEATHQQARQLHCSSMNCYHRCIFSSNTMHHTLDPSGFIMKAANLSLVRIHKRSNMQRLQFALHPDSIPTAIRMQLTDAPIVAFNKSNKDDVEMRRKMQYGHCWVVMVEIV